MTVIDFVFAMVRLAAIVLPAWATAHLLRSRLLRVSGALAVLAELVLALSVLLVIAEVLGVASVERFAALVALLAASAVLTFVLIGKKTRAAPRELGTERVGEGGSIGGWSAAVTVVVVAAQWGLQTANSLGGGMFSFDTLWYHMPFAARFAQSGSITGVQWTQADPFTAYYPANSELVHALGILALRNDFLSPVLNLMWLAIALLASWCVGSRWGVRTLTLSTGALVFALPVLSTTQPGEAFSDVLGLAMLLAAVALLVDTDARPFQLVVAGLALGIAVGTKYTFVVPAFVLAAGLALLAGRGHRARVLGLIAGPLALTGGWWYLRDTIAVGNPLGLTMRIGPLHLPGPTSAMANASQETVFSQVGHLSLWGSRFAPGLDHALGPLWPVMLVVFVGAVVAGLSFREGSVRVVAVAGALAAISYLFLPTGATALTQGPTLFQVNLRYATPALALGLLLVPILVRARAPRLVAVLGPSIALVALISQLEGSIWPTQTARHVVFSAAAASALAVLWKARGLRSIRAPVAALAVMAVVLVGAAATFAVERHYLARRYVGGLKNNPGLGAIYRWAQTVSHARIALYGTVEQYPLYGARDTDFVDYLGQRTAGGGYEPITSCRIWRTTIITGRYQYVVLTPGPTQAPPLIWSQDPAMVILFRPAAGDVVFRVTGRLHPDQCT